MIIAMRLTKGAHNMNTKSPVRSKTVRLISRLLTPIVDEGIISVPEYNNIISNLKSLAEKGSLCPQITPKLIDQTEAGNMLGISLANFKAQERAGAFPFKRKMVGSSVRYRNTDIIAYIMSESNDAAGNEVIEEE